MEGFSVLFQDPKGEASKAWCRQHFDMINEGGAWAVPRSGLIFRKEGNKFICTTRMPHDPKMPVTAAQLTRQQDADVEVIRKHFAEIDVIVEDQSVKL